MSCLQGQYTAFPRGFGVSEHLNSGCGCWAPTASGDRVWAPDLVAAV